MNVLKVDYQSPSAAKQFALSLSQTGFAVITNHPIQAVQIQEVYRLWSDFFNSESKHDFLFDPELQDGYFPMGLETAKGNTIADIKEFFHVYPHGRIPEKVKTATLNLRASMMAMAEKMLEWLQDESPKEIRDKYFCSLPEMVSDEKTLYRILNYPAFTGDEQQGAIRAAAHEDINLITLLPASSASGLQVKDTSGNWHDVPCDYGSIAVNAGDMLDMASNGYFPATTHRVINPEGEENQARMSMPLFVHPRKEVLLKPGYTAENYLLDRLKEIGLKS